jgi:hypothetical protein
MRSSQQVTHSEDAADSAVTSVDTVSSLYASTSLVSREVFDCSEYERAAFALATARVCLNKLPTAVAVSSGQTALIRQLDQKCTLLTDYLVKKIRSRLCSMYSDDNRPGRVLHS